MNKRQETILKTVVKEFIDLAEPIGSKFLSKKYDWGISAASIRNDLAELSGEGYLEQPHTSAGRVPTDKGYQFFVRMILDEDLSETLNERRLKNIFSIFDSIHNEHRLFREAARVLAEFSENLGITAVFGPIRDYSSNGAGECEVFKFGMPKLLRQPDFDEIDEFWRLADDFETIDEKILEQGEEICETGSPRVFIGKENPLVSHDDWSLVISGYESRDGKKGITGILGPKRMKYGRNISLVGYVSELLSKF